MSSNDHFSFFGCVVLFLFAKCQVVPWGSDVTDNVGNINIYRRHGQYSCLVLT